MLNHETDHSRGADPPNPPTPQTALSPMLTVDAQTAATARHLAATCVKIGQLDTRTWVLLNFPRRTSLTLYLADDGTAARLIAETAVKVVIETFEYLLAMQAEVLPPHAELPMPLVPSAPVRCFLKRGIFDRWFIVNSDDVLSAWSGSRWVPVTCNCVPASDVQVCNFGSLEAAAEYAREFGFEIGGEL